MTFDDISKLGLGTLGLLMLYSILKPLIASLIAALAKMVENMEKFSAVLQSLVSMVSEMRTSIREQAETDGGQVEKLLRGDGCRFETPENPHGRVIKP